MLKYVLINLGIGLLNLGITAYRANKTINNSEKEEVKSISDAGFLLLCWLFYSIPLINIVILACLVFCKGGKK